MTNLKNQTRWLAVVLIAGSATVGCAGAKSASSQNVSVADQSMGTQVSDSHSRSSSDDASPVASLCENKAPLEDQNLELQPQGINLVDGEAGTYRVAKMAVHVVSLETGASVAAESTISLKAGLQPAQSKITCNETQAQDLSSYLEFRDLIGRKSGAVGATRMLAVTQSQLDKKFSAVDGIAGVGSGRVLGADEARLENQDFDHFSKRVYRNAQQQIVVRTMNEIPEKSQIVTTSVIYSPVFN